MGGESTQSKTFRRLIRHLDPIRVENSARPGTPDINYIGGWVETKWARRWPARGGPLRLDHFTPQQRTWLKRRWRRGGAAYVLLTVGQEWLLLDGEYSADHLGHQPREILLESALVYCPDGIGGEKGWPLRDWLTRGR